VSAYASTLSTLYKKAFHPFEKRTDPKNGDAYANGFHPTNFNNYKCLNLLQTGHFG
jgi:hypothetical protein